MGPGRDPYAHSMHVQPLDKRDGEISLRLNFGRFVWCSRWDIKIPVDVTGPLSSRWLKKEREFRLPCWLDHLGSSNGTTNILTYSIFETVRKLTSLFVCTGVSCSPSKVFPISVIADNLASIEHNRCFSSFHTRLQGKARPLH